MGEVPKSQNPNSQINLQLAVYNRLYVPNTAKCTEAPLLPTTLDFRRSPAKPAARVVPTRKAPSGHLAPASCTH